MTVAGLVLAAGAGRRLGRPKALVRFQGRLLVERAAGVLADAGCAPVVVVVGAEASAVVADADLSAAAVVVNAEWEAGVGSSLACGLSALAGLGAPAVAVLLVDQPRIGAEVVCRLVDRWRAGATAVVATYDGRPRNPVVLDASVWADVRRTADGDHGARVWLRAHQEQVTQVPCDDIADPVDVDTPDDLAALSDADG